MLEVYPMAKSVKKSVKKSEKISKASAQYMVGVEKLPVQERGYWNLDVALPTFDPKRHGGEAMADAPVDLEKQLRECDPNAPPLADTDSAGTGLDKAPPAPPNGG